MRYGQKVALEFSDGLGVRGYLSSRPSGRSQLSTQLVNKQEVYMQVVDAEAKVPYDCAWVIQPTSIDERIVKQGAGVDMRADLVLVHCFTNKRLAGVHATLPTDFGDEMGVCAHTYTDCGKVGTAPLPPSPLPLSPLPFPLPPPLTACPAPRLAGEQAEARADRPAVEQPDQPGGDG